MKKLRRSIAFLMAVIMAMIFHFPSGLFPDIGLTAYAQETITLSPLDGTEGVSDDENYKKLIDGDKTSTKWCVTNFSSAYIVFQASEPISVNGYTITTGNDNATENGRNPKDWKLQGCNDYDAENEIGTWTDIDTVTDDTTLQDENNTDYKFSVSTTDTKYQYFRLEITAIQSGSCMQMSEFTLSYSTCEHEWGTERTGTINPTCTEGGYDVFTCSKCGATKKVPNEEPVSGHTKGADGKCTGCGTYMIEDAEELKAFAAVVTGGNNSANALLTADIQLNAAVFDANGNLKADLTSWTPIGRDGYSFNPYTGTFDGQGHTISGLFFDDTSTGYVGLFCQVASAGSVLNVGIVDSYFQGGSSVGGICGYNYGTITNCYYTGTVSSTVNDGNSYYVGGICGYNGGTITNCYHVGTVSSTADNGSSYNVGGVCGYNNGTITNCYHAGTVSSTANNGDSYDVGGIYGYNWGVTSNCYYLSEKSGLKEKTKAQFNSGAVAYLLSQGCEINGKTYDGSIWGQKIGTDEYPVLERDTVYATTGCVTYNNTKDTSAKQHSYENGICTGCGKYQEPEKDESNRYQISNLYEFYWFVDTINSGNGSIDAVLTNDITVNNAVLKGDGTLAKDVSTFTSWTPIGSNDCPYNGTFDGQGHTISGLYLDDTSADYVGLFGKVNSGSISNVGIVDSYLKGDEYVGGVCGYIMVSGGITNCYTTSVVSGSLNVGGLCGSNEGKITNCYFNNSVSGINDAVGYTSSGATCSKVSGKSTAQFASGEVAYRLNNATSEGSLVWGQKLSGEDADAYPKAYTGTNTVYATTGCVTYNNSGDTSAKEHQYNNNICTVCGKYEEPEKNENGVYQISKEYEMYWFVDAVNSGNNSIDAVLTKDITINDAVLKEDGTLAEDVSTFTSWTPVGSNDYPYNGTFDGQGHTISGLFFNDTNSDYVGLFSIVTSGGRVSNVGIVDSYFEGDEYVGGICGENNGTITNCCITAAVKGTRSVGGVCGRNYYNGKVENCYFNNSVSGTNEAVEFDYGTCSKVSGKSTEQFASGEVTYLLNNATSEGSLVWGQKLSGEDADAYPKAHTGTNTVYATTGCVTYNNSGDTRAKEHQYENGICKDCSEYEVPEKDENGVYQISNKGELYWFANTANSVTDSDAVLTRNIIVNKKVLKEDGTLADDVSTFTSWTPIGRSGASYFGTFDGQGHTISGLYLKDTSANFVGLFGSVGDGGKILNVGIVDSYFEGRSYVGGICGENYSTIQNCYNSGTVSGSGNGVGGVCGENKTTIQNCYNSGTVSGSGNGVGGVCGENIGTIQNCYNTGTVNGGGTSVGGVCGFSYYGEIVQCYNTGTVTKGNTPTYSISGSGGKDIIKCYYLYGGLGNSTGCTSKTAEEFKNGTVCDEIGYHSHQNGICIQCGNYKEPDKKSESECYEISDAGQLYWFAGFVTQQDPSAKAVLTADITVNRDLLASLTLDNDGSVTNGNDFTGWTPIGSSGKPYTGTFDGQGHTISGLFFDDTNSDDVGLFGAVGSGGSVSKVGIVDSYLKGKNNVGGVSGANSGTITDCYNTAAVSGSTAVGGICGANSSTITNCFNYYVAVSGTSNSVDVCGENNNTGTIKNCYYLAESETDDIGGTTCKTAAQFQSGAVAYLLNDSKTDGSQVWYQDIDKGTADAYPVLNNTHGVVYQSTPCTVVYSNTQDKRVEHIFEKVNDDSHKCQACSLEEVHTSAYSADDTKDTITVTCGGCHEEYGTVQLSAPTGDLTYDAAAKEASVTSNKTGSVNLKDFTVPAITYKKGEEALSSAPTDAGTYTASITLGAGTGAATVSVEYSIQQATPYIATPPSASAITYGQTLADAALTSGSVQYSSEDATTVDGTFAWEVDTTKPAFADSDKTEYVVVFKPTDKDNYEEVETKITLTVNKADAAPNKPDNTMSVPYGTTKVSEITTLPTDWAWQDADDKELTVGTPVKATAVYTGADKGNYKTESVEISITRLECTHHTYVNGVCSVCDDIFKTTVDGVIYQVITETGTDGKPVGKLVTVSGNEISQVAVAVTGTDDNFAVSDGKVTVPSEITGSGSEQTFVVTKIAENAFAGESSNVVTEIVVPATVTEVETGAFGTAAAVTFNGSTAPSGIAAAITEGVTVNVPEGAVDSFKTALGDKADIVEAHTHTYADTWTYDDTYHWHASTCGHETEVFDKAVHTFGEWTVTKEATEDAEGVKERSCSCGYKETAKIDKLAHTTHVKDEGTRVEPTCEEKGSITYKCTKCGEVMEVVELAATGHKWDEGKVTKEPTETAEGVKTYTCSVCGKTKTEAIPKKTATTPQPPKKGDVLADDKTSVKVEVTDVTKKEVEYKEPADKKAKTVSIPATVKIDGVTYKVTKIDDNAFKNNKTVTKVTVGSNIKTIGKNAFSGATKLKTVKIGKNVTTIENNAFKGCTSLTSVTLGSKTTKIGANAFNGCKKLKTIKITSTKLTSKTVAKNAFKGLTKATTIKVPKKKLKDYKKLFKQKGLSSKVKVIGY